MSTQLVSEIDFVGVSKWSNGWYINLKTWTPTYSDVLMAVSIPFISGSDGSVSLRSVERIINRMGDALSDYRADLKIIAARTEAIRLGGELPPMPELRPPTNDFEPELLLDRLHQAASFDGYRMEISALFLLNGISAPVNYWCGSLEQSFDCRYHNCEIELYALAAKVANLTAENPTLGLVTPIAAD